MFSLRILSILDDFEKASEIAEVRKILVYGKQIGYVTDRGFEYFGFTYNSAKDRYTNKWKMST